MHLFQIAAFKARRFYISSFYIFYSLLSESAEHETEYQDRINKPPLLSLYCVCWDYIHCKTFFMDVSKSSVSSFYVLAAHKFDLGGRDIEEMRTEWCRKNAIFQILTELQLHVNKISKRISSLWIGIDRIIVKCVYIQ